MSASFSAFLSPLLYLLLATCIQYPGSEGRLLIDSGRAGGQNDASILLLHSGPVPLLPVVSGPSLLPLRSCVVFAYLRVLQHLRHSTTVDEGRRKGKSASHGRGDRAYEADRHAILQLLRDPHPEAKRRPFCRERGRDDGMDRLYVSFGAFSCSHNAPRALTASGLRHQKDIIENRMMNLSKMGLKHLLSN